jgi:hypothetical protein
VSAGTGSTYATTPPTTPTFTRGWKPTFLLAPIPTSLVGKVEFYSDGTHTVLGPVGWTCSIVTGTNGVTGSNGVAGTNGVAATAGAPGLAVYPSTTPNPPVTGSPPAGTEGIFASFTTTGTTAGIAFVCPFFTIPSWQQRRADCTGAKPTGEQSSLPTPDIASVTDPAGVFGSLAGSGGPHAVTGTVLFPQVVPAVTDGSSVAVAAESCSLADPTLCPTILSDFVVREFPVPTATSGYSSYNSYSG